MPSTFYVHFLNGIKNLHVTETFHGVRAVFTAPWNTIASPTTLTISLFALASTCVYLFVLCLLKSWTQVKSPRSARLAASQTHTAVIRRRACGAHDSFRVSRPHLVRNHILAFGIPALCLFYIYAVIECLRSYGLREVSFVAQAALGA